MKRTTSRRFLKMVTVLCAAVFLFGCTTTVFAATDLVGRGTTGGVSTTATVSSTTGSSTGSTTGSTTGRTTGTTTVPGIKATVTDPVVTNNATTTRVKSNVQTGVMEKIYPFLISIAATFVAFILFFHLQMNQVRYGKSEKYHKELLDFICACKP